MTETQEAPPSSASATKKEERYYQVLAEKAVMDQFEGGTDSTLVLMATGTGKTHTAGRVIKRCLPSGRRALWLVHTDELINQAVDSLVSQGFKVYIEKAGQKARKRIGSEGPPDVVVGSVQTLQGGRLAGWDPEFFGLIITDECHHARAPSYHKVYDHFRGYWHLGVTATADRGDKKNLGKIYKSVAFEYSIRSGINDKYLCPIESYRIPCSVNLKGIRTTAGDFNAGEVAERIGPSVEALCRAALESIGDRQTIIFTPDIGSAQAAADVMRKLGKTAKYVSGDSGKYGMDLDERRTVIAEYKSQKFQIITCADLLTEGFDDPATSCVVIMKITKKRYKFVQMVGRATRKWDKWPEKKSIILDFDFETDPENRALSVDVELLEEDDMTDEERDAARAIMARGKKKEEAELLAKEIIKNRQNLMITLTGTQAPYRVVKVDPLDVSAIMGVTQRQKKLYEFSASNPKATDGQVEFLKNLGVTHADGLDKQSASRLIAELKTRKSKKLSTPFQVSMLMWCGVPAKHARSLTADAAKTAIKSLERDPVMTARIQAFYRHRKNEKAVQESKIANEKVRENNSKFRQTSFEFREQERSAAKSQGSFMDFLKNQGII